MMIFRQPSDLARIISHLLDQLQAGDSIELIFSQRGQDTRVFQYLLEVVIEVARERNIPVDVTENG